MHWKEKCVTGPFTLGVVAFSLLHGMTAGAQTVSLAHGGFTHLPPQAGGAGGTWLRTFINTVQAGYGWYSLDIYRVDNSGTNFVQSYSVTQGSTSFGYTLGFSNGALAPGSYVEDYGDTGTIIHNYWSKNTNTVPSTNTYP